MTSNFSSGGSIKIPESGLPSIVALSGVSIISGSPDDIVMAPCPISAVSIIIPEAIESSSLRRLRPKCITSWFAPGCPVPVPGELPPVPGTPGDGPPAVGDNGVPPGGANPPPPPIPARAPRTVAINPGTATPTIASVVLAGPGILPTEPTPAGLSVQPLPPGEYP